MLREFAESSGATNNPSRTIAQKLQTLIAYVSLLATTLTIPPTVSGQEPPSNTRSDESRPEESQSMEKRALQYIAELDDDDYSVRRDAEKKLIQLGKQILSTSGHLPWLMAYPEKGYLDGKLSIEQRFALQRIRELANPPNVMDLPSDPCCEHDPFLFGGLPKIQQHIKWVAGKIVEFENILTLK